MGGQITRPENITDLTSFESLLNEIASTYIQSMNFGDMLKLQDPAKGKELLILTKKIISNELTKHKLTYNETIDEYGIKQAKTKDATVFTATRNEVKELKIPNKEREEISLALAIKYFKIANIFAAIYVILDPEYETKICEKTNGEKKCDAVNKKIHRQKKIIKTKRETENMSSFCAKRLNALINKKGLQPDQQGNITIKPALCDYGIDKETQEPTPFMDEPGILELDALYKDIFVPYKPGNENSGGFFEQSNTMKKKQRDDAITFFEAITGESFENYNKRLIGEGKQPASINSFSDITMNVFNKSLSCSMTKTNPLEGATSVDTLKMAGIGSFTREYSGSSKNFVEYGQHIRKMEENARNNYLELRKVIAKIFAQTPNGNYTIDDNLTDNVLDALVDSTRKLISNMYIQCERDFRKGVEIFESIIADAIRIQQESIEKNIEQSTIMAIEGISED